MIVSLRPKADVSQVRQPISGPTYSGTAPMHRGRSGSPWETERRSPDWPSAGSPSYFFIIILIRHETTAAARWALPLIVRTLFNDAITVAVWTGFGFHVSLPVSLTRQPN